MDGGTIIEVVAIHEKTRKVYVSEKTYAEWLSMDKKENYIYTAFQKGKQMFKLK